MVGVGHLEHVPAEAPHPATHHSRTSGLPVGAPIGHLLLALRLSGIPFRSSNCPVAVCIETLKCLSVPLCVVLAATFRTLAAESLNGRIGFGLRHEPVAVRIHSG